MLASSLLKASDCCCKHTIPDTIAFATIAYDKSPGDGGSGSRSGRGGSAPSAYLT